MFLIIFGAMILLMQVGFVFVEGGSVRYRNLQSIFIKIFSNTVIAIVAWWLVFIFKYIFY
jgi:Amt family ammonium transporter